ncbi:MAG: arginyltransferase [Gammaproteobacteria bacterium]|nr:arginyltransferase [Gammaproteobacteria bacterium]
MSRVILYQTPEHNCPYLADKMAITQFVDPTLSPDIYLYTYLCQRGFRRSGEHIYIPDCPSCNACISIRIPVHQVTFSKNQKRCLKRAQDLEFFHREGIDSDEHYALYENYINNRHKGGDMYPATRELFGSFLISNWADSHFLEIRLDGQLIACAVYDQLINGLSAIYCYFDPQYSKLSPGKLAILKQIEFARENWLEHLYLGYQIDECRKMNYKTNFHPTEQFIKMDWIRKE